MGKKGDVTIVILGASGDLTKKKLIPTIYNLLAKGQLGNFAIIGVAKEDIKKEVILNNAKKYIKNLKPSIWKKLQSRFYYHSSDFYATKKFCDLGGVVSIVEGKHGLLGNRLFYLATLPQHFKVIAQNLKKCGLHIQKKNWTRVVFEKPFGDDLKSAKAINRYLNTAFSEEQIYRVDHYLEKELVENIAVARFTNTVLEPIWNNKYIDHVQIVLSEDIGVEKRGRFYDQYGAVKDVIQNHALQLLALATMEAPKVLSGEYLRDEKVKVLKSIRLTKNVVLGQYNGYTKEEGVKKNSKRETFAALKLFIDNKRWKGVPFYLIAGKNMPKKTSAIYLQFKQAPCLLFKGVCNFKPNYLVIQIQPDEGFYLQLNAKKPGKMDIASVKMDFCYSCTFGPNTPEAYENLFIQVLQGNQSVFVRTDEIEQQWKLVDALLRNKPKVVEYRKGSLPKEAMQMIQQDNRYWHVEGK